MSAFDCTCNHNTLGPRGCAVHKEYMSSSSEGG